MILFPIRFTDLLLLNYSDMPLLPIFSQVNFCPFLINYCRLFPLWLIDFSFWNDWGFLTLLLTFITSIISLSFYTERMTSHRHWISYRNNGHFLHGKSISKWQSTPQKNSHTFIISERETIFKGFYIGSHLEPIIIDANDLYTFTCCFYCKYPTIQPYMIPKIIQFNN